MAGLKLSSPSSVDFGSGVALAVLEYVFELMGVTEFSVREESETSRFGGFRGSTVGGGGDCEFDSMLEGWTGVFGDSERMSLPNSSFPDSFFVPIEESRGQVCDGNASVGFRRGLTYLELLLSPFLGGLLDRSHPLLCERGGLLVSLSESLYR